MDVGKHLFAVAISLATAIAGAVIGYLFSLVVIRRDLGIGLAFPIALTLAIVGFTVVYRKLT